MNNIKDDIDSLLRKGIDSWIFPSYAAAITIIRKGVTEKKLLVRGKESNKEIKINESVKKYYDLASLTKPLATALSIIILVGEDRISLNECIEEYLPEALPADKRAITIFQLLNHSSGLPAHRPYHEKLVSLPVTARKAEMRRLILAEKLTSPPGAATIYSDLGYLLLGMIIERMTGVGLAQYFAEKIAGPLGLSEGIFYNPPGKLKKPRHAYFPTENCPWRGKVLQGEVSDENCWALGGVAGHAGLFGDIESVLGLTTAILEIWQGSRVHPHLPREVLTSFLEARSQVNGSTWALGFDRPTPGSSSSGRYLSSRSVGHLGFTGTSFWIDPDKGLVVVLLTNRVHPSRDNNLIKEFRPYFHDRVVELLGLV